MNLSLFIAKRYFFSKKISGVVHLISGISLAGITVCSFALIVILSVFNGLEETISKLYNIFDSDLKVVPIKGKYFHLSREQINNIKKNQYILGASEVIEENAVLKYGDKQTIATFKGIDPPYLRTMKLDSGVSNGSTVIRDGEYNYTLVGSGVAARLKLQGKDDFRQIEVYVPGKGEINILEPDNAFNHRGIYPSGRFSTVQEFDDHFIIVPLSFARMLEDRPKEMTSFEIKAKNDKYIEQIRKDIAVIVGPNYKILDRYEQEPTTYKVMKSEKFFVYLILTFIMLIAAFNMVGGLLMLTIDKKQDLMALLSMGATQHTIRRILFYEGLLLSVVGGIIGIILGTLVSLGQQKYGWVKINGGGENNYFVLNSYPIAFQWSDFILIVATVIVLGLTASWYPAVIANKRLNIQDLKS